MPKRVILITGTPSVGKTTASELLATRINALYLNLTQLATDRNLILGKDKERNTIIVDETRMRKETRKIIQKSDQKDVIIDSHYAVNAVPKELITHVFVLRRNPVELKTMMEKNGFRERKLWENLASEILDVCLVEALNLLEKKKICEIDTTGKSAETVAAEILDVLNGKKKGHIGTVDWIGKLEQDGLLDDYLRM